MSWKERVLNPPWKVRLPLIVIGLLITAKEGFGYSDLAGVVLFLYGMFGPALQFLFEKRPETE